MSEDEARDWVRARLTPMQFDQIETFAARVIDENARQNLISPASIPSIWSRHIMDSLQLREWGGTGAWLDIGTGGGFPGMILAIAGCTPIMLVEPRKRRAEFLQACVTEFGLTDVVVQAAKVEQVRWQADVITARAVASIEKLLLAASHCATQATRWLLPRGALDVGALPSLAASHQLVFHVEQSLTSPDSAILILDGRGA